MNSKRDFDRAVEQWLDEGSDATPPEVINAVLLAVRSTPQERRFWWPAWRTNRMNTSAKLIAAAAAVLVVTIGGYQFLPGGSGSGGTGATPSPSPSLLARGSFVLGFDLDRVAIELEATAGGSSVTGRMTVSARDYAFTVDLQCARTTEDGLILIGGVTTETTSAVSPEGTWAGIGLERGSPVQATIWSQRGGDTSRAPSCLAYLDEQLTRERGTNLDGDWMAPIEGTVELGP